MKKLPLGIQTFAELIQENYLYIDKTRHIAELLQAGKYLYDRDTVEGAVSYRKPLI